MNIAAKRVLLILVVSVLCAGCDQITKSIAKSVLSPGEPVSYMGDTVRLQLAYNNGAFLSVGSSLPEVWRQGLFVGGVGALLLGILAYAVLSKRVHRPALLALSLLFAGGISNLLDRLAYSGHVVDFINVGIGPFRTGIFNVADVAIMVGMFIFLVAKLPFRQHVR